MISVIKLLFCNSVVSDIFLYNSVLNDHDNLAFTFLVGDNFGLLARYCAYMPTTAKGNHRLLL